MTDVRLKPGMPDQRASGLPIRGSPRGAIQSWREPRSAARLPVQRRRGMALAAVFVERPARNDTALTLLGQPVDAGGDAREHRVATAVAVER